MDKDKINTNNQLETKFIVDGFGECTTRTDYTKCPLLVDGESQCLIFGRCRNERDK